VSTFWLTHNLETWSDIFDNLFTIIRGAKSCIFALPIEAVKHCISACNHGFEWKLNEMSTANAVSGISEKLHTYFSILKEVVTSDGAIYREEVSKLFLAYVLFRNSNFVFLTGLHCHLRPAGRYCPKGGECGLGPTAGAKQLRPELRVRESGQGKTGRNVAQATKLFGAFLQSSCSQRVPHPKGGQHLPSLLQSIRRLR
jgi:hypothetical protein